MVAFFELTVLTCIHAKRQAINVKDFVLIKRFAGLVHWGPDFGNARDRATYPTPKPTPKKKKGPTSRQENINQSCQSTFLLFGVRNVSFSSTHMATNKCYQNLINEKRWSVTVFAFAPL